MLCRLQKAIASFLGLALCLASVHGQDLSSATLAQVEQRLAEKGTAAWELGTRTQALLELTAEQYSVFNTQNAPNIPPPASIPSSLVAPLNVITGIARTVVNNRPNTTGYHDAQPLFYDNLSVGDPCSMGVAVLLANWTRAGGADFVGAAQEQLNYLLNVAPRSPQGAISHRNGVVELWSDNVYMVPPFLAYYGAMTNNQSLIQDAYQQINLYRNALRDGNKTTAGLWFHVVMGPRLDYGHWSTGMGWAAAGMMRVYATIANSRFSNSMQSQKTDISNWVNEIHGAIYPRLDPSGLFRNYADNKTDFLDSSGAALIAASVYRTAVLTKYTKWIPSAEITRKALFSTNADGSLKHFDANGWLTPVVDPYSPGVAGAMSPEGEGFVLELHSAYQDWVKAGSIVKMAAVRLQIRKVVDHYLTQSMNISDLRYPKMVSAFSGPDSAPEVSKNRMQCAISKLRIYPYTPTPEAMPYVSNCRVVYGTEPSDAVTDISGHGNDINKGFGGEFVYLVAVYTDIRESACNQFVVLIQSEDHWSLKDLAKGAGGDYRFLLPLTDRSNESRIKSIRLLRSASEITTPPSGYHGMTEDINKGREGTHLYLLWTLEW